MYKNVIHQIKTAGERLEGMGYVIECDDGSTILVDGGMWYDADVMYDYLKSSVFVDSDIVIDAWILTHTHPDHTFCAKYMAINHADDVKVKKFIYNFPCPKDLECERGANEQVIGLEEAISVWNPEHIVPRRGDRYTFGSAVIDILFTHEDLPAPAKNLNDTSTVFRLTASGQKALFLGDAEFYADDVMIELYGNELKSDIVQMAHHGSFGSSKEFYRYVDPEFLFWPSCIQGRMLDHVKNVPASHELVTNGRTKDIFLAANGHVACPMPIVARETPFFPEFEDVPYKELKAQYTLNKAEIIPDINDPHDKAWEQSPLIAIDGQGGAKLEGVVNEFRMLWSEDKLYVNVHVTKEPVCVADKLSSSFTEATRLMLTEKPITDRFAMWTDKEIKSMPENRGAIRLYPDKKDIDGVMVYTSRPAECRANSVVGDKEYYMCAEIDFKLTHKKGDFISINFEVNGFNPEDGKKNHMVNLVDNFIHWSSPNYKPSALAFCELV